MVSKYVLMDRDVTLMSVFRLLKDFGQYGHLYDDNGEIKSRYKSYHYEDGVLYDAYDGIFEEIPEVCSADGSKYLYFDKLQELSEINVKTIEFKSIDSILKDYLNPVVNKLIAMLRRGMNYANDSPIPVTVDDVSVTQMIASLWRFMVIYHGPPCYVTDEYHLGNDLAKLLYKSDRRRRLIELCQLGLNPWEMEDDTLERMQDELVDKYIQANFESSIYEDDIELNNEDY